jgi:hypothetical protein
VNRCFLYFPSALVVQEDQEDQEDPVFLVDQVDLWGQVSHLVELEGTIYYLLDTF